MRPKRRTRITKAAQRKLIGYSAVKETDPTDGQIQTFTVTHPDGHVSVWRTCHGQDRWHFWNRFPMLANAEVWEDVK